MHNPSLSELPSPPPGKIGWPWTEESPQLPDTMPDGRPWPRVSIVTPSYNQEQFIEETIRPVLLQGYPNLEYVITDGGSTDGTIEILRKYGDAIFWLSEPDEGQSDAINKGLHMARGEILAYLNSDDTYMPGTISTAVAYFQDNPDVDMVFGDCNIIDEHSSVQGLILTKEFDLTRLLRTDFIPQPTVFFRRQVLDTVGFFDARLHYAMDYDLWLRVACRQRIRRIPCIMANFRLSHGSKSVSQLEGFFADLVTIFDRMAQDEGWKQYLNLSSRQIRGLAHFNVGVAYYGRGQMPQARSHLLQAARLYPRLLVQSGLIFFLGKSLLGPRLTKGLRRWWHVALRAATRRDRSALGTL